LEHEKIKKNYAEVMMVAYQDGFNTENTDSLLNQELEQLVNSTLENLPLKCRQIFIMSRFEGKKYKEIADELSISVKTVETQIGRALSVFRKALSAYLSVLLLMIVK
ncbi:MAG: sigma-70 family RNA polymerase sigma factor, partial [Carboxylicivirga sp.]|nr:sigma-70 family RNA polymerase sigma factor [Carboxylicivirga sp.]